MRVAHVAVEVRECAVVVEMKRRLRDADRQRDRRSRAEHGFQDRALTMQASPHLILLSFAEYWHFCKANRRHMRLPVSPEGRPRAEARDGA